MSYYRLSSRKTNTCRCRIQCDKCKLSVCYTTLLKHTSTSINKTFIRLADKELYRRVEIQHICIYCKE